MYMYDDADYIELELLDDEIDDENLVHIVVVQILLDDDDEQVI